MRTAAAPLMWASAGPCVSNDEAGLLREGDFQHCLVSCLTPLAFASSVGYSLKNTESRLRWDKGSKPTLSLWNDRHWHFSDKTLFYCHIPLGVRWRGACQMVVCGLLFCRFARYMMMCDIFRVLDMLIRLLIETLASVFALISYCIHSLQATQHQHLGIWIFAILQFYFPSNTHRRVYFYVHRKHHIFMIVISVTLLQKVLCMLSHTCCCSRYAQSHTVCLHTVPFTHPNKHAHTQMQSALDCQKST